MRLDTPGGNSVNLNCQPGAENKHMSGIYCVFYVNQLPRASIIITNEITNILITFMAPVIASLIIISAKLRVICVPSALQAPFLW